MKLLGQERDKRIYGLLDQGSVFSQEQIEQVVFHHLKPTSRRRKSYDSLSRMEERKLIKKVRDFNQNLFYIRKPKQVEHSLLINHVYCSLISQKKTWYKIQFKWRYEIFGGMVVADALIIIDTLPDKKGRQVIFLEVERSPSKRFDKDIQYKRAYDMDYSNEEWCVMLGDIAQFPSILIVTEEKLKVESPLRFIVATPEQVKKDVYSLILRR